jgi:hypothetical protein
MYRKVSVQCPFGSNVKLGFLRTGRIRPGHFAAEVTVELPSSPCIAETLTAPALREAPLPIEQFAVG